MFDDAVVFALAVSLSLLGLLLISCRSFFFARLPGAVLLFFMARYFAHLLGLHLFF